jgi:hypothetical protein
MKWRTLALGAALALALVVAPTASASNSKTGSHPGYGYFGATSLKVDSGTLGALGSLGVTPGAVAPGRLEGATYAFPITNPLGSAIRTGVVRHAGGISLSAGGTTVKLTDFDIKLRDRLLFGKVNGAGPVALLDLDYSDTRFKFRWGGIELGPVSTTLTQGAATALNQAFGVSAFTDDTVIGKATTRYRIFPF